MKRITALLLAVTFIPFIGLAHEGHGHTHGFTITHYIVEPQHAYLTWLALAVVIAFMLSAKKNAKHS
jgi:hypothetical protein